MTIFVLGLSLKSWCQDTTQTLPADVNTTMIRLAHISGLSQNFNKDGTLYQFGDLHSFELNSEKLSQVEPKVRELVSALNKFGNYNLGTQLNVGTVRVDVNPLVDYFAPVYARGMTEKWTLGFALPVVTYSNTVRITDSGSNIAFYKNQFSGLSTDLDAALNQLSQNMATVIAQRISENGYKSLQHNQEKFLGDIQLVNLLKLHEDDSSALLYRITVGLPTGPKYDADDLSALNIFGRQTIENQILYSQKYHSQWSSYMKIGLKYTLTDHATYRVPINEDDVLPTEATKEDVRRQIGNEYIAGGGLVLNLNTKLTIGGFLEGRTKESDIYIGGKNSRYDLLSANTDTKRLEAKFTLGYSTVNSYLEKKVGIPMSADFTISETIAGNNTDKRETQEFVLSMFF